MVLVSSADLEFSVEPPPVCSVPHPLESLHHQQPQHLKARETRAVNLCWGAGPILRDKEEEVQQVPLAGLLPHHPVVFWSVDTGLLCHQALLQYSRRREVAFPLALVHEASGTASLEDSFASGSQPRPADSQLPVLQVQERAG